MIERIYLTEQLLQNPKFDTSNCNTDVIVALKNGDKYAASFFTYKNIETLQKVHEISGEFLGGVFFWARGMVLVKDCSKSHIETVVNHLVEEGLLLDVFWKL